MGEHGYESRSENCCFAGRTLHGSVLLTVAAGAVAYRERPRGGRVSRGDTLDASAPRSSSIDVQEAFRRRCASFDDVARSAGDPRPGRARARHAGARHRAVPEGPRATPCPRSPSTSTASSAHRRRPSSPPRGPTASTSRGRDQALVCGIETHVCVNADRARPARPRASRSTSPPTRSPRARAHNRALGPGQDGARRRGASPASRRRCSSCSARPAPPSSRRSRSWSCDAQP